MKAIYFPDRSAVSITTLPDPAPGPGEVMVEVKASGICHTDIEVLRGNYGTSAFPLVPGHEFAGVIDETGEGVDGLEVGTRVVVDPNIECGTCRACKRGWAHLCETLRAYGVTQNGGFAERCVVSASAVHPIGDMAFDMAALAEPLGCVLNGLEAARARGARRGLVFGAGPIGMLLALGARAAGVGEVCLVDIDETRLDLARGFGFDAVPSGGVELQAWRRSADIAMDATGVAAVASSLVSYVADGGTCLFFGICPPQTRIEISPFDLFRRQITLAGSHSLNHNIPEALVALRKIGPDITRLVSHKLPLEEVAEVFGNRAPAGSLKIQAQFA